MSKTKLLRKLLLYPISLIYGVGVGVRNKLFDLGVLKQHKFDVPVIVVGNIAVGGTGKTPHTEYIVEQLSSYYVIGVLSRGYKRHTKGFVLADAKATPTTIGDEPYQIYKKFGSKIPVAVCENRVKGIQELLKAHPEVNLVVLDDAFQHRYVKPTISVVLTEFARPYFEDSLLPYGRLRESKSAMRRADVVIVTKCADDTTPRDYMLHEMNMNLAPFQKLYYSNYEYGQLRPVFPKVKHPVVPQLKWLTDRDMVLAVAGIANPKPFVKYVKSYNAKVKVNVFPDHHEFDAHDMALIEKRFKSLTGKNNFIITTEKDAVRLANLESFPQTLKPYVYYVPVRVNILRDKAETFTDDLVKLLKNNVK